MRCRAIFAGLRNSAGLNRGKLCTLLFHPKRGISVGGWKIKLAFPMTYTPRPSPTIHPDEYSQHHLSTSRF